MTDKGEAYMKLKDRPADMQPRERLMNEPAHRLSDVDLLAILLRTGTKDRDVLALSEAVLKQSGGLVGLLNQNMHSLCNISGIGPTKACTLLATIEIGRRLVNASKKEDRECVRSAETAATLLRENLHSDEQEAFFVLYLDAKNRKIHSREMFVGTVNGANVHQRDIFREAVRCNAVNIIVGHNHPSGDVTPSREDKLLTKRIQEAAAIIGIPLLDHIILGTMYDEKYYSFKEHGYLE